QYNNSVGIGYFSSLPPSKALDATTLARVDTACVPLGARHRLGLPKTKGKERIRELAAPTGRTLGNANVHDKDGDGIPDVFDADNNDDGVLDNDDEHCNDTASGGESSSQKSFYMFTNFHLDFEQALNMSMPGVTITKAMVDNRLQSKSDLAIQVI